MRLPLERDVAGRRGVACNAPSPKSPHGRGPQAPAPPPRRSLGGVRMARTYGRFTSKRYKTRFQMPDFQVHGWPMFFCYRSRPPSRKETTNAATPEDTSCTIWCICMICQMFRLLLTTTHHHSREYRDIVLGNRSGGLVWRNSAAPGGSKGFAGAAGPRNPHWRTFP